VVVRTSRLLRRKGEKGEIWQTHEASTQAGSSARLYGITAKVEWLVEIFKKVRDRAINMQIEAQW